MQRISALRNSSIDSHNQSTLMSTPSRQSYSIPKYGNSARKRLENVKSTLHIRTCLSPLKKRSTKLNIKKFSLINFPVDKKQNMRISIESGVFEMFDSRKFITSDWCLTLFNFLEQRELVRMQIVCRDWYENKLPQSVPTF